MVVEHYITPVTFVICNAQQQSITKLQTVLHIIPYIPSLNTYFAGLFEVYIRWHCQRWSTGAMENRISRIISIFIYARKLLQVLWKYKKVSCHKTFYFTVYKNWLF